MWLRGHVNQVSETYPATFSLNDYIRDVAGLKGTKVMCREAGCGCCSVAVTHAPPDSDKLKTYSVQSCMTPLYTVDGWQINTVEGIGNQKKGFHPIQKRIAEFNGSQCGYCTPGVVMNMYGLLHNNQDITSQDIEDNFDGNLCRCTGYRSILDAMKSFATDSNIPGGKQIDIEDLNKNLCPETGQLCQNGKGGLRPLDLSLPSAKWFRPTSIEEVGSLMEAHKDSKIRFVLGNTGSGIYKNDGPYDVYIDLHRVKYLYSYLIDNDKIRFGAATTLSKFIDQLKANQSKPGFHHFATMIKHLKVVANVMVRNAGSIAGNLMAKHDHPEFPSDVFLLLEASGTKIELYDAATSKFNLMSMLDFMGLKETNGKIITTIEVPKLPEDEIFKSFKVTQRWQCNLAYVNAVFRMPVQGRCIKGLPSIVFGGISAGSVHAKNTETYLEGKVLSKQVIQEALDILKKEIKPEDRKPLSSPKYRTELACSLLYKILLGIYKPEDAKLLSGPECLHRPLSSGLQTYQEIKSEAPLKQAMPKKTAPLQASGEAIFVNDIPTYQNELFGAFVQAKPANATIGSIDASEALSLPGVVAFLSAKDIPEGGENNYMPPASVFSFQAQELFAEKDIFFSGQSVGMIVAESRAQAMTAVNKIKVNYSEIRKPILTLEESIEAGKEFEEIPQHVTGSPDEAWSSADHVVSGHCRMGSQYHFFMETHSSLAVPSEDGIDLFAATQFGDMNQNAAAHIIGKPLNYINVTVPRVGGGFGGKAWDCVPASTAATLAAYVTDRPVRIVMDLPTTMTMCGKRMPILAKYKVGFNIKGEIQVIELDYYVDCGHLVAMDDIHHSLHYIDMAYNVPHWKISAHAMMTNKQKMSPTRSPGSVPAAFIIETILEHAANKLKMHPIHLKELNLYEKNQSDPFGHSLNYCTIKEVWKRLKDLAEVEGRIRQVDNFNKENLWKKKGITMAACKYGLSYFGTMQCHVAVYAGDGTIVITQTGVEMGQGLYTKVAQSAAHALGVPMDIIKVRSNQNLVNPNAFVSGGSVTSEVACLAALEACNLLKEKMQPIKEKFPDADWAELCKKCNFGKIDLSAKFSATPEGGKPFFNYFTYSVAVIETEVDILTGEYQIKRVDFMADIGESLNPTIDIGQIEGAFTMGLGCYLLEDTIFDETSGAIVNHGTLNYKPPTAKDIPIDWRIHLLPDTPNPLGIRSSKAVGEPPISLSVGALLANQLAVQSAREDLFQAKDFIPPVAPYTVEKVQQSVGLRIDDMTV